MKIFVINLSRATERRARMQSTFEQMGLEFEFFDAVDASLPMDHVSVYNDKKRVHRKGSGLVPGEVGCFASHYLMWKKAVELNETIVVLEDDAVLSDEFKDVLENHIPLDLLERNGYLRLGKGTTKTPKLHVQDRVYKYLKWPASAAGYIITPAGAERFLKHTEHEWVDAVDNYMDKDYLHGNYNLGIEPELLVQNDHGHSFIPGRERKKISLGRRLVRNYYRGRELLMTQLANLKFLLEYKLFNR
ncbi:glycosyltransferase family 25 protein [Aliagarivorans taiwanensis]|uniref:glycosyltransferase family 25 protein n=1 Tax=Aliagarivorans taiwanensis TaxID=561966 RepID=UPI000A010A13|nr:glycosyltransferase family 25 protein [Aliagarivorans taiwanensis]